MRYLGVDFGLRRIGLAISEGELASPFKVLKVRNFRQGVEAVIQVVKNEGFDKVVVGLPEGKIGQTVVGFIKALVKNGLDVATIDENLSTKHATARMIELGVSRDKRKVNDDYSAAEILQSYLDSL